MFLENKYTRWYKSIIENVRKSCRTRGNGTYYESHHIVPKTLGGDNSQSNLVLLTPKEHFICHRLLCKMLIEKEHVRKMKYAFWCMCNGLSNHREIKITSHVFESIKREYSDLKREEWIKDNPNNRPGAKERQRELMLSNNPAKDPLIREKMRKPKSKKRVFVPCSDAKKAALSAASKANWNKRKSI